MQVSLFSRVRRRVPRQALSRKPRLLRKSRRQRRAGRSHGSPSGRRLFRTSRRLPRRWSLSRRPPCRPKSRLRFPMRGARPGSARQTWRRSPARRRSRTNTRHLRSGGPSPKRWKQGRLPRAPGRRSSMARVRLSGPWKWRSVSRPRRRKPRSLRNPARPGTWCLKMALRRPPTSRRRPSRSTGRRSNRSRSCLRSTRRRPRKPCRWSRSSRLHPLRRPSQ